MGFIRFSLKNSPIVLFCFLMISAFGVYSVTHLKIDAYPDVSDTEVIVITKFDGRASSEVEKLVSIPLERALTGIPGLTTTRSQSIFGLSVIRLTFKDHTDEYFARNQVNERLKSIQLPEGTEAPELGPLTSPVGEILRYAVEGDGMPTMELRSIQDWELAPRLQQIQGVADVITFGGDIKEYQIEINPINQDKYNVFLRDLVLAIEENNANTGGNIFKHGNQAIPVRALGAIENEKDIENIIVTEKKDIPIYVKDIGKVRVIPHPPKGILGYRLKSGKEINSGVQGIIMMRKGENPTEVLRLVKDKIKNLEGFLKNKGIRLRILYDREELVSNTLKTVVRTMMEGITIVMIVLIFLLGNYRVALAVAVTIPFSLLFSFCLMHLIEIPANLLSLGAIDFGIIVDSSIVIIEGIITTIAISSISKKKLSLDEMILRSSDHTEKEVFFSIAVILCAYLPIFLFERVEGKLFKPMAFGLAFTLIGALLFSLTVLPVIFSRFFNEENRRQTKELFILTQARTYFLQFLHFFLNHSKKISLRIYLVVATLLFLVFIGLGTEFLPELDEGAINFRCKLPTGIHLDRTANVANLLRETVGEFPEAKVIITQSGRNDDGTDPFGPNRIEGLITLEDYSKWKTFGSKSEMIERIKEKFERIVPGAKFSFSQPILDNVAEAVTGSAADLSIQLSGRDVSVLWQKATEIESALEKVQGVSAIGIEQEGPNTELVISIDREAAARAGINFSDIQDITEIAVGGKEISKLYLDNHIYNITVRYPEEYRTSVNSIGNINIKSKYESKYPLSSVAKLELKEMPAKIARKNGNRMVSVWINIEGRDQGGFVNEAKKIVTNQIKLPSDVEIEWGGQFENLTRASKRLMVAVPLTFAIILFILYLMFHNISDSLLVMSSIPVAALGGLSFLLMRGMHFNVSSGVGLISLFGISIMGGVLFVSNFNHEKENLPIKTEEDLKRLISHVSEIQFRPRFLTLTTAIIGLLPAMLTNEIGSDIQRPMATVIVGGLLFTLIIGNFTIPLLCYLSEQRKLRHAQI
ncbi:efflux RND transporter permease subunit [Leptospira meyeri]|uniref:efflux RND transporter permease subunit n=1 Tax=Leptospira meyeri TaxID=29508 RepID=UPI001083DB99|nr:CusA/CzcA family heavy metal efflux RND transporter [Leptospira meyeri]TGM23752.1 efflux RND transporter permease subunit [Leptospira meyeri]